METAVPDARVETIGDVGSQRWGALLDQPFDLLLALEARVRATKLDLAAGQSQSWTGLAFRLRDLWLVAPREDVREVIVPPRLTRIPGAKPWMLGVANVRGNLLPVTDLGSLLGWPVAPESRAQRVLTFNSDRLPAGLLVDEVAGYRSFAPADQRPDHVSDQPALAPYLLGAFFRDGRRWQVLSLHRLTRDPVFTQAGQ
jgi:twitching motility protein PilI